MSTYSDSSDYSDDDLSQKSGSLDTRISQPQNKNDRFEEYKNQQAPPKFWQFAWLFKKKEKELEKKTKKLDENEQLEDIQLAKIKEQLYEGEESSSQPLFHLSLCGHLLKKKSSKEEIVKMFYQNRVEYNAFIKDPLAFINDSNLVVKIEDSIYTWQLGIAILTCRFAFGKQLENELIQDIIKNKFTKSKWLAFISGQNITKLDINETYDSDPKGNHIDLKKFELTESVPVYKYSKSPDSQKLRKMKLKYGENTAKFVMDFGNNMIEEIRMKIFLWDHAEKIIISDIDGTITKSDILGQILSASMWLHTGVTKLFSEITKRNYKIIYLTARAIGQYQQTKKFLEQAKQDETKLPQGPLLMSPDGYVKSFKREVIDKTPDTLKTKLLASLNQIFPQTKNPIFCGFGNRITDSIAYSRINISPERIFCINDKSVVTKESDKQFLTNYPQILQQIDQYFPEYLKQKVNIDSEQQRSDEFELSQLRESSFNRKHVKSEENLDDMDLEGFDLEELQQFKNISKGRKSQHSIPQEDMKGLQEFINIDYNKSRDLSKSMIVNKPSQSQPRKQEEMQQKT